MVGNSWVIQKKNNRVLPSFQAVEVSSTVWPCFVLFLVLDASMQWARRRCTWRWCKCRRNRRGSATTTCPSSRPSSRRRNATTGTSRPNRSPLNPSNLVKCKKNNNDATMDVIDSDPALHRRPEPRGQNRHRSRRRQRPGEGLHPKPFVRVTEFSTAKLCSTVRPSFIGRTLVGVCRYYGIVQLVPIFQYSNMYAATSSLRQLASNVELCKECIAFVAKVERQPPLFRDVFQMYW